MFQLFLLHLKSQKIKEVEEEEEEKPFFFKCFTPAGPVYAFLANLYSGPADVGRRSLCAVLFPAFLCLSAPPLRTCSPAIVYLCGGLASGEQRRCVGQNAKSRWLLGSNGSVKRWLTLKTVDTTVEGLQIYLKEFFNHISTHVAPKSPILWAVQKPKVEEKREEKVKSKQQQALKDNRFEIRWQRIKRL